MLSSEGHGQSRWSTFAPRLITALGVFVIPGCLLVQPLDDARDDGQSSAGESGNGGSSATGGSRTGGTGGAMSGTGGATGGASGATSGAGGKGGAAGSGGSATGGRAGAGGAGGAGGNGNTGNVPLPYVPVWTFDEGVESWEVGYSEPSALGLDATATHSTADGEPDDGSVEITVPFDGPTQTVEVGVSLPRAMDFTGETLAARVKLDSGFFGTTEAPGGVKLFVKTGNAFDYADGAWSNLIPGEWVTVVFDLDAPDYDDGIDPTDVRELGVTFKSTADADADWTTATLYLDTVGWVGAERPPCLLDPSLIDDMETPDGIGWVCETDGRDGGWYVFDDMTAGTRTPSGSPARFPLEDLDVARGDSTQAVHISGSGYTGFGGGVGTTMVTGTADDAVFWDASRYAGISFWARGSGTMWAQMSLAATRAADMDYPGLCENVLALNCNDNYVSNAFELTDAWTEYVVPFATLRQEGWGHPAPWMYDLHAIEFRWGTDGAFDFWIDDVRFLERECNDDDTVECTDDGQRCARGKLVSTDCDTECSRRGYQTATCTAAGCACDDPEDPDVTVAIDAMCQCAGPELDCTGGRALLEELATDPQSSLGSSILCYAGFTQPDECPVALTSCWDGA
jgi:hypothetical protein